MDVFSREYYKEIFINSLKHCQENKGLNLHACVIMTNHVHLIISSNTNKIEDIVRDLKKYTSKKIIAAIQENRTESRKEWMLNLFSFAGKNNNNNTDFQFWKQDYHPIELNSAEKLKERIDYLPVRTAGRAGMKTRLEAARFGNPGIINTAVLLIIIQMNMGC
ncbi:MAG: transposase [Ferruginibacter sp.]